jgi:hypothetical protein
MEVNMITTSIIVSAIVFGMLGFFVGSLCAAKGSDEPPSRCEVMEAPRGFELDLQLTNAQGDERVWSSRRASLASCQACGHVLPRGASAFVERKWNR